MTIRVKTEIYYYCTVCDKEYAEEDKEDGLVLIACANDDSKEDDGCASCMYQCYEPDSLNIRSRMRGCGRWFCGGDKCKPLTTKFFDTWYPKHLCRDCIKQYGLERFYGLDNNEDQGEALWKEIQQWKISKFYDHNTGKVIRKESTGKKMSNKEIDQRIFERYYKRVTTKIS